ncbi:MAG TPA: hypothetical protein VFS16_10420 [Acidimicrobiia bacterium]|nr:hypothetical protein [Acidimicrobiia bacterium]
MSRILLRRSVGRPALLAATAVIAANTMLRKRQWVHEWLGAYFNFHFVLIFLGPLAAGLGAWEGARLARSRDLLQSSGQARRALIGAAGAVFAWILGAYGAGLVGVTIMVKVAGTPGWPGLVDVATLVPAIAFLAMWVVVGTAAGYRFGSPLVAPLATVASFTVILVLYIVDYDLVRVGGASASLLGLAPYPIRQAAQTVLYLAAGAWSVLWATRPARSRSVDGSRISSAVAGGLALVLAAGLFLNNAPDFDQRPIKLECTGSPPICLAGGYAQYSERVRAALSPLLAGLKEIGAPLPRAFRQELSEEDLVGTIPDELALGDQPSAVSAVISAYSPLYACDVYRHPGLSEQWDGLYEWLDSLLPEPALSGGPGAEAFRTGTKDEQAAWLRNAIDRLRRCA